MKDEIKVSVFCTVYNHKEFLHKCLESMVTQKTNFRYEILVHDDCSKDGSIQIIEEYAAKYPELIIPIYESENQYSKGKSITEILLMKARGEYVACCEGDDFWCDENKLQLQYDYIANHPECSMVVHNTIKHDLLRKKEDTLFFQWKDFHVLNSRDVFWGWNVHYSSYFLRKETYIKIKQIKGFWAGDYVTLTMAYDYGEIMALPNIMSVYNYNNINGVTYLSHHKGKNEAVRALSTRKDFLNRYKDITGGRHNSIVDERILEIDFQEKLVINNDILMNAKGFTEKKQAALVVKQHKYFNRYYKELAVFNKMWAFLKYQYPIKGVIWYLLISLISIVNRVC